MFTKDKPTINSKFCKCGAGTAYVTVGYKATGSSLDYAANPDTSNDAAKGMGIPYAYVVEVFTSPEVMRSIHEVYSGKHDANGVLLAHKEEEENDFEASSSGTSFMERHT